MSFKFEYVSKNSHATGEVIAKFKVGDVVVHESYQGRTILTLKSLSEEYWGDNIIVWRVWGDDEHFYRECDLKKATPLEQLL